MKIAERGQVTIPKRVREECGLAPGVDVEFFVENGRVYLKKKASPQRSRGWNKWVGRCAGGAGGAKNESVDDFIEEVRGR